MPSDRDAGRSRAPSGKRGLSPVANGVEGMVQVVHAAHSGQAVTQAVSMALDAQHESGGSARAQTPSLAGVHLA
jgi:glycerate kinase